MKKLNINRKVFCCNKCKNMYFNLPINKHLRGTFAGNTDKGNLSTYRRLAFNNLDKKCYYCKYDKHENILQVHHIDNNRKNNKLENLRILCPTCHAEEHLGLKTGR
jgi:5-methylcytosine-specific restriction endonuclease McrA